MQVELSLDELRIISDWGNAFYDPDEQDTVLLKRIQNSLQEAEELESIDLNDCAGGACKL